ncbi:MAG TPA: alpha/beta family hydrolase [Candidatus Krumholzibacteria bacterium]
MKAEEIKVVVSEQHTVSALLLRPADAWAMYVFAHGAGAGMRHPFMESMSRTLASAGVATLRYQFPYTEEDRSRPDPPVVLEATVRAAVDAADNAMGLPLFAGGKSMGGRMTSQAYSQEPLQGVRGLIFFGFPLHAPRRSTISRASHLDRVSVPMLFLQGTRDDLANLDLMKSVCAALGSRATLHIVEGGDHSFKVLKRSGRDETAVMGELRDTAVAFMRKLADKEQPV